MSLANSLAQAVSQVGVGASSNAYADAVSNTLGNYLARQGLLTDSNAASLASSAADALASSAGNASSSAGSNAATLPYGIVAPGAGYVAGPVVAYPLSNVPGFRDVLSPLTSALSSASAESRVRGLAQSVAQAVSSGRTLDVPTFFGLLGSVGNQISTSSVSLQPPQVVSQTLVEGLAALLQVLNGAQISNVNVNNLAAITPALVQVLA